MVSFVGKISSVLYKNTGGQKMPVQFKEICQRCKRGEVSTRQAADVLGISHSTFYTKYRKEIRENGEKVLNYRH